MAMGVTPTAIPPTFATSRPARVVDWRNGKRNSRPAGLNYRAGMGTKLQSNGTKLEESRTKLESYETKLQSWATKLESTGGRRRKRKGASRPLPLPWFEKDGRQAQSPAAPNFVYFTRPSFSSPSLQALPPRLLQQAPPSVPLLPWLWPFRRLPFP